MYIDFNFIFEENIIREKNLKMQSLIYEALLTATEKYKCTTFEQFEYVVPRLVVLKLSKINKIVKNKMSYDLMEYVNNLAIPNPENNSEKKEIEEPKKKQRKNNKGSSDFVLIVATIGITLVILVTITIIVFALAK